MANTNEKISFNTSYMALPLHAVTGMISTCACKENFQAWDIDPRARVAVRPGKLPSLFFYRKANADSAKFVVNIYDVVTRQLAATLPSGQLTVKSYRLDGPNPADSDNWDIITVPGQTVASFALPQGRYYLTVAGLTSETFDVTTGDLINFTAGNSMAVGDIPYQTGFLQAFGLEGVLCVGEPKTYAETEKNERFGDKVTYTRQYRVWSAEWPEVTPYVAELLRSLESLSAVTVFSSLQNRSFTAKVTVSLGDVDCCTQSAAITFEETLAESGTCRTAAGTLMELSARPGADTGYSDPADSDPAAAPFVPPVPFEDIEPIPAVPPAGAVLGQNTEERSCSDAFDYQGLKYRKKTTTVIADGNGGSTTGDIFSDLCEVSTPPVPRLASFLSSIAARINQPIKAKIVDESLFKKADGSMPALKFEAEGLPPGTAYSGGYVIGSPAQPGSYPVKVNVIQPGGGRIAVESLISVGNTASDNSETELDCLYDSVSGKLALTVTTAGQPELKITSESGLTIPMAGEWITAESTGELDTWLTEFDDVPVGRIRISVRPSGNLGNGLTTTVDLANKSGMEEESDLSGINKPLKENPVATLRLIARAGVTIYGKDGGKFRLELEEAPAEGTFVVPVIQTETKDVFYMEFDQVGSEISGEQTSQPVGDPGAPVVPSYPDITISSGEPLKDLFLRRFTLANGNDYPVDIRYTLSGLPAGFAFSSGNMQLAGTKDVLEDKTYPLILKGVVDTGIQENTTRYGYFNLKVLAAAVVNYPQPSFAPVSALTVVQGEEVNIQPTITYPAGQALKSGEYTATGLPVGLSINKNSGKITGKAVTGSQSTVTLTFTDTDKQKATVTFVLTVQAAPVSANVLAASWNWDYRTRGINVLFKLQNVVRAKVGLKTASGALYLGHFNGTPVSTDPQRADFQYAAQSGSFEAGHNWMAGFYPFSLNPLNGGIGPNEKIEVFLWMNDEGTPQTFWFITDPVKNVSTTPMLLTEPSGGGGVSGHAPVPPGVEDQEITAGKPFRHEFPLFQDEDLNDVVSYTTPDGLLSGMQGFYDQNANKLVVQGTVSAPGFTEVVFTGTDLTGQKGYLKIKYTVVAVSQVTAIYRRFYTTSSGTINGGGGGAQGGITTNGNLSYSVAVAAAAGASVAVQARTKLSTASNYFDWVPLTKGSDGRYGIGLGPFSAGQTVLVQIQIIGQTDIITLPYTIADPLSSNGTAEVQVWPQQAPDLGYTEYIISTWTN